MFSIEGREISRKKPPYIIAELSGNHNGSIEKAFRSIEKAKENGANAIKIQTYSPETMTINCNKPDFVINDGLWKGYTLFDLYKEAHTPFDWHERIFSYARKSGITIFSSPFDETAVDLLESLGAPAYKIASFEICDLPLIKYIAKTNKPILISTGMASEMEITEAIDTIRSNSSSEILLFHCISAYPAPLIEANLKKITLIRDRYGVEVGLSDHTMGNIAAISSIALGAVAIEKHFTLSRSDKGPDSEFSIEPNELYELTKVSKEAWAAIGKKDFIRSKSELKNKVFRRSLYFVNDLKAGDIISNSDIRRIRPGFGLPPKFQNLVIGKKVKMNVEKGDPVKWDYIIE